MVTVLKSAIFAYFSGEKEIIIDPSEIEDSSKIKFIEKFMAVEVLNQKGNGR